MLALLGGPWPAMVSTVEVRRKGGLNLESVQEFGVRVHCLKVCSSSVALCVQFATSTTPSTCSVTEFKLAATGGKDFVH